MSSALAAFVQRGGGSFPESVLPLVQMTTHHHLQTSRGCVRLCAPVWVGFPRLFERKVPIRLNYTRCRFSAGAFKHDSPVRTVLHWPLCSGKGLQLVLSQLCQ